jgi:serine phosphatase RsbU (regulator of sigma subunit)
MLDLNDFFHLPQVDVLVEQLIGSGPGLTVIAGLDPRPSPVIGTRSAALDTVPAPAPKGFLPSGRSAIFGILVRRVLAAARASQVARTIVVAESKDAVRLPDGLRRGTRVVVVQPPATYIELLAQSVSDRPDVLVLDTLDEETAPLACQAAAAGAQVLCQLDCVFAGSAVARHLSDLGLASIELGTLTWIVTVQRLPRLCQRCRLPAADPELERLAGILNRYPDLPTGPFYQAAHDGSCTVCRGLGQAGDVAAFDFFQATAPAPALFAQPSLLPLDAYVYRLGLDGQVALDDLLELDAGQLRRTYHLLTTSERALRHANTELSQKVAELEAANRVLRQRTQSLMSLEGMARALIESSGLADLARRIGAHGRDLCGAERSVLYVLRPDATAEVLAVEGWDPQLLHSRLAAEELLEAGADPQAAGGRAAPFTGWPPGVPPRHPDVAGAELRAGLRVPLIAQHEVVGLMIVHSTRKARFTAAEVALLQAYADQAALAIQRAGLIESLRDKVDRLEAAQAELAQKARMERDLELARQVQQSLLPQVFPELSGVTFAARSEPARRVGGDFYDVFTLAGGCCGVAIADVSDKGLPAALFMALTRSLLLAEARREASPRHVLLNVHALLLELGDPEMFVTVFYGVIDPAARTLTYARAGHERPILLREGAAMELPGKGIFLGLLESDDLLLTEEQIALQAGDRLILYTDGLTDALNPDEIPFGRERFAVFLAAHAGLPPAALCNATFAELAAYQGQAEQFDDMALVVTGVS